MSHPPSDPADAARVLRRLADVRTLHEALRLVRTLDQVSSTEAGALLVAVGEQTGHSPTCVARGLLHLRSPTEHPPGPAEVARAVRRRWAGPLHRLTHPGTGAHEQVVWSRVRDGAVPSPRPALN